MRIESVSSVSICGSIYSAVLYLALVREEVLAREGGNVLEDEDSILTHIYFLRQRTPSFVSSRIIPRASN
jgi:hypothetical protein